MLIVLGRKDLGHNYYVWDRVNKRPAAAPNYEARRCLPPEGRLRHNRDHAVSPSGRRRLRQRREGLFFKKKVPKRSPTEGDHFVFALDCRQLDLDEHRGTLLRLGGAVWTASFACPGDSPSVIDQGVAVCPSGRQRRLRQRRREGLFFFRKVPKLSPTEGDHFVFALDCRQLDLDEHRGTLLHLEGRYEPHISRLSRRPRGTISYSPSTAAN